ncbi:hypothetical protein NDU88_001972 [Pleurodeles waltl]|uniref:Uncharacterized protein n=1 Tax=Pleurodeles waltl TaxID=8319 RepID=A0AAV7VY04_PLEWA|nr:hypothetical protein NDU88_001972 [Pleurodeles waltl]
MLMAARHSTPRRSQSHSRRMSPGRPHSHHHSSSSKSSGHSCHKKKKSKKDKRSSTSPRHSDDVAWEESRCSRPLSSEPSSGSAQSFPDFPGAGATPAQLKEFYEAMRLIFGQTDPPSAPLGTGELVGAPSGSKSSASATAPEGSSGSNLGSVPTPVVSQLPSLSSGQTSMLPTSVGATININPILITDEPERRRSTSIPFSMGSPVPRVDPDPYAYGYGYGESLEGMLDPLEYQLDPQMDWVQDLGDASGLDTSPDTGMLSPRTVATEEGTSYFMVVQRAAEVLDLELSSVKVSPDILTNVLQPGYSTSEPLLPFNEALTDVLLGTWSRPITGAPVNRTIARRQTQNSPPNTPCLRASSRLPLHRRIP